MSCRTCGGSGVIELLTSKVPCECRTAPKDSVQGLKWSDPVPCSSFKLHYPDGRVEDLGKGTIQTAPLKPSTDQFDVDRCMSKGGTDELRRWASAKPCPYDFRQEYLGAFTETGRIRHNESWIREQERDAALLRDIERVRAHLHGVSGLQQAFDRIVDHVEF